MNTIITAEILEEKMVDDWLLNEFEDLGLYGKSLNEIVRFYLQRHEIWSLFSALRELELEHKVEEFQDVLIEFKDVKGYNGLTILEAAYMTKSNDIINFLNEVAKEQQNDVDNGKKKEEKWIKVELDLKGNIKKGTVIWSNEDGVIRCNEPIINTKNNFFNNNMIQTITATGDIVAFCGLLKEIEIDCDSDYGFVNKIYSFFKNFIHNSKTTTYWDDDCRERDTYYIPSMCIKVDNIKIANGVDFYKKELVLELKEKDAVDVAKLFADKEKKIMFDISMTSKDDGSVEYKYTNFRKII